MVASPLSLRLPDAIAEQVRRISAIEHRSMAETVRVLTEEALIMREFPDIVFVEGPSGRRASFRNGLEIWEIVEPYLVAGKDWGALRASYPEIDEGTLREAVRYYERYPAEIEGRVELNEAS